MIPSILFPVTITTYSTFKLKYFSTFYLIYNIIIIRIYQKNSMSSYGFSWILLKIVLGISWTSIIPTTSIHGWIIVRVGTLIFCCSGYLFQYQLIFSWMEQIYCALTTNPPAEITCPTIAVLFWIVYASEMNIITYNPFVVVSAVLMAP